MAYTTECTVKRETDNAVLIVHHDTGEEVWIPLSQVEEIHRDRDGRGAITMSDWIARQKGFA